LTDRRLPVDWVARLRADIGNFPAVSSPPPDFARARALAEVMSVLYLEYLRYRPENPAWAGRDRLIFADRPAWPVYRALLYRLGVSPATVGGQVPEESTDTRLEPWPDMNLDPGVDFSCESAGAALAAGVGMAIGLRSVGRLPAGNGAPGPGVFVLLGLSELTCGRMWMAANHAGEQRLARLCVIVHHFLPARRPDGERPGAREQIQSAKFLEDRFRSFGWESVGVDGSRLDEIRYALDKFKKISPRPYVIIARTQGAGDV